MAKFLVPENVGKCRVAIGLTGLWTVTNDQRGKNSVLIPCKTHDEAKAICGKLNTGNHNGQINVPDHVYHAG